MAAATFSARRHAVQAVLAMRVRPPPPPSPPNGVSVGSTDAGLTVVTTRNVRRILVRGANATLPPEAKKILKF